MYNETYVASRERNNDWAKGGIMFVTRLKSNAHIEPLEEYIVPMGVWSPPIASQNRLATEENDASAPDDRDAKF